MSERGVHVLSGVSGVVEDSLDAVCRFVRSADSFTESLDAVRSTDQAVIDLV